MDANSGIVPYGYRFASRSSGADMGGINGWRVIGKKCLVTLLVGWIGLGLFSCRNLTTPQSRLSPESVQSNQLAGRLAEVAPPKAIQELHQALETYQPQVQILSPRSDQVFQNESVTVRFQVRDLPIFQNPEWRLGPHLNVFLDDQPYQAVYDPDQTLVFSDLSPGSHTIRVVAARPWDEIFKNQGAYAQTTFHILTRTARNNPALDQPLLTYSSPQDTYGAEPIMLDFYLTNAPLHMIALEDLEDEVSDWRIRCTINGERFVFDQWRPIYLKGFKPGMNWIQLELIDETGNLIPNAFNDTVRLIEYEPNGTDTLSEMVRGELAIADILGIVDPDYEPPQPEPEPTGLEPEAEPEEPAPIPPKETPPTLVPIPEAEISAPSPLPELEELEPVPGAEPELEAEPKPITPESAAESVIEPEPAVEPELPPESAPTAKEAVEQTEIAPLEPFAEPANEPEAKTELQPQAEPTVESLESQAEESQREPKTLGEEPAEPEENKERQLETPVTLPEVESMDSEPSQPVESTPPPADEATAQPTPTFTEKLDELYNRAQNFFQTQVEKIRDRFSKPDLIPPENAPTAPEASEIEEPIDLSPPEISPEALEYEPELPPNSEAEPAVESIAPEQIQPIESTPPPADEGTNQPAPTFTEKLDDFYKRAQNFFQTQVEGVRDRFSKPDLIPSEAPSPPPDTLEPEGPTDLSSPEVRVDDVDVNADDDDIDSAPEPQTNSETESLTPLDEADDSSL